MKRNFFGYGGHICYLQKKAAAMMLQSAFRALLVRQMMRRRHAAAARIEQAWRASILALSCPTLRQYAIQMKLRCAEPYMLPSIVKSEK